MTLELQINARFQQVNTTFRTGSTSVMVTPPVNEDYWVFRVPVSEKQAVVAFPKFSTYGIGFQHETDWNTNLPYTCPKEEIWKHIKHNKGDDAITDDQCLSAIEMLQTAIANVREKMKGE